MDAISRNTASVAQDFHKAGGVQELKIPANHQLLFNNKLPSQWTTKEAAALLHSLSNNSNFANNYQQHLQQQQQHQRNKYHHQHHNNSNTNGHMRQRQHSTGEDDENTPSSASSTTSSSDDGASPLKGSVRQYATDSAATTAAAMHHSNGNGGSGSGSSYGNTEQRKAMSAFLSENFDLQETSETVIEMMAAAATSNNKRKYQQYQRLDNDEDQENQEQLIRSPPAYNNNNKVINYHSSNNNNSQHTKTRTLNQRATNAAHNNREHRLELPHIDRDNKENNKQNAATFLTTMEYQNLNKVSTQIQNYVKDIISKYYAETPLMYPAMPTATETPHGSQQPTELQLSQQQHQQTSPTRRKRMLSETEEYIEYLRNKEDITLTITPKVSAAHKQRHTSAVSHLHQQRLSPTHSTLTAATPAVTLAPIVTTIPQPIQTSQPLQPQPQQQPSKRRKSLSQIATLLPLLADAACQQQYLTAPLDFSKKPMHAANVAATVVPTPTPAAPTAFNALPTLTPTPATALVTPIAAKVSVIQAAPVQKQKPQQQQSAAAPTAAGGGGGQSAHDKRSSRKQAQPKKIRAPPEVIVALLRDKYLNRMVDHKLSCRACAQDKQRAAAMLVFNYHTKGSLALHKYWRHRVVKQSCRHCKQAFKQRSSLVVHCWREHRDVMQSKGRRRCVKMVDEKIKKQRKRGSKNQSKQAKKAKKAALKT